MNSTGRISQAIGGYTSAGGALGSGNMLNQQSLPSESQTMLRHAVSRLSSNGGILSRSIIDIRETLDRLIGTQPQDAKNGTAPQAVPNGDIQAVHFEIDALENMLSMLSVEINRLRTL